jgi:hypothetical protein
VAKNPQASKKPQPAEETVSSRGPGYPAISLREAVQKVQTLYANDGKAGAIVDVVAGYLGYKKAHGAARALLSAMKKYGLIEYRGGRVVPSSLAVDILEFPEGHPRRATALKTAALTPDIYRRLVEAHEKSGSLPSDQSLKPELKADWGFSQDAADDFLRVFRDSLLCAGLLDGNRLLLSEGIAARQDDSPEERPDQGEEEPMPVQQARPPRRPLKELLGWEAREQEQTSRQEQSIDGPSISFPLPRGNLIEIRLKFKVTPDEFAKLKQIFDLSEIALVEDESYESATRVKSNPDKPLTQTTDHPGASSTA